MVWELIWTDRGYTDILFGVGNWSTIEKGGDWRVAPGLPLFGRYRDQFCRGFLQRGIVLQLNNRMVPVLLRAELPGGAAVG